jgi:hypothetical protein
VHCTLDQYAIEDTHDQTTELPGMRDAYGARAETAQADVWQRSFVRMLVVRTYPDAEVSSIVSIRASITTSDERSRVDHAPLT